jgi:outer membrane protein assembly factor BamB
MASVSGKQFLRTIEQSNLLTPALLAKLQQRVASAGNELDGRRIAKGLVDKGYLTLWQARQLLAGRTTFYLGRYRLLDRIGKGGMGVVFKAQHAVMDRIVALKVMSPALLNNPRAVARFNREVKTAAALNHPNIVTAFDADAVGNTHFLVMEYVPGLDLNQWLRKSGPFPVAVACECALQAAEGLAHAHRLQMVHRDIKPVNLVVTWNQETNRPVVKILDMGLARFVSEFREDGEVTRAGQTIGTPDYIAPEAAQNFKKADIRADLFSLGCALFKLLTGRLPFGGENTMEKLLARTTQDAPPVRSLRPDVSPELEAVVAKLLARNPDQRYQTPAEVVTALVTLADSAHGSRELEMFREDVSKLADTGLEQFEPDADTSLVDFFRDVTAAPQREDGATGVKGQHLEDLALTEDLTRHVEGRAAALPEPPSVEAFLLAEAGDYLQPDPLAAHAPGTPLHKRSRRKNRWDSNLIVLGGGALALLLAAGGALAWALNRQSGDESLALAEDAYQSGAYRQAISQFDTFLSAFPNHEHASRARVERGMAKLRQAADAGTNWPTVLELTNEVLGEIGNEKDFPDARDDLNGLLTKLAEGLSEQAQKDRDAGLVTQAEQAIALADQYIPSSERAAARLTAVQNTLALTRRQLASDAALAAAVGQMQAAAAAQEFARGFELRRELVTAHPELQTHATLVEAVRDLSQKQAASVVWQTDNRAAVTAVAESPIAGTALLAVRQGEVAPAVQGEVVPVLAGGALLALDAGSGRLLWRRYIGGAVTSLPVAMDDKPGADWLAVDSERQELVRVGAADGELKWRSATEQPLSSGPVRVGGRVYLAEGGGRLATYDSTSGERTGVLTFPQALATGPGADVVGRKLYVPGDHSTLYVVDSEGPTCREAYYLGQSAKSIALAPLVVGPYVVVAENRGLHDGVLHFLAEDADGQQLRLVRDIPIEGHLRTPLLVDQRMLAAVTDQGAIYCWQLGPPDQEDPIKTLISRPATDREHVARFALLQGNHLWVAAHQLARYDFQTSRGQMDTKWQKYDRDDVFVQPLASVGNLLVHVRRRGDAAGLEVAGVEADSGKSVWQTQLAAPVAGALLPQEKGLEVLATSGGWFRWAADAWNKPTLVPDPVAVAELQGRWPSDADSLAMDGDLRVSVPADSSERWLAMSGNSLSLVRSPAPIHSGAVRVDQGMVVAAANGPVMWVDPVSGESLAEPFQPPMDAFSKLEWRGPVLVAPREVVLADLRGTLFRLVLVDQPKPHWEVVKQVDLIEPIRSRLAVAGEALYGGAGKQLLTFRTADLSTVGQMTLDGALAWGPYTAGDAVLAATERGRLSSVAGNSITWNYEFEGDVPVGAPFVEEGRAWLASRDGRLLRLNLADGKIDAELELGQPLATGPVQVADELWVATPDGAVLKTAIP